MGQLVGPGIELGVAQPNIGKDQCRSIRRLLDLMFNQGLHWVTQRIVPGGVIPAVDDLCTFTVAEQVQFANGPVGPFGEAQQQVMQVLRHAFDHGFAEGVVGKAVVQRQGFSGIQGQGQRVVGLFEGIDAAKLQAFGGLLL